MSTRSDVVTSTEKKISVKTLNGYFASQETHKGTHHEVHLDFTIDFTWEMLIY